MCGPQYNYSAFAASALSVGWAGHATDSNIGTVLIAVQITRESIPFVLELSMHFIWGVLTKLE